MRITTAITRQISAAAFRGAWATIRAGERLQRLGELMEAGAQRLADRWRCGDEVLAPLINEN